MNENINLVEILKDCPVGTEFYTSVYGVVKFDKIDLKAKYPIKARNAQYGVATFTTNGKAFSFEDSECVIFPSKNQRDWKVWYNNLLKEKAKKAFQSFNDGDYIHFDNSESGYGWTIIYRKTDELKVRGYVCVSDDYISIMEEKGYVGTKPYAYNVRLANLKEIDQLNNKLKKLKKQWNPFTNKIEPIKTEMTISEIEEKLGLTSGSLRIKK